MKLQKAVNEQLKLSALQQQTTQQQRTEQTVFKSIVGYFGKDKQIQAITTNDLIKYVEFLQNEKKNKPSTINLKLSLLCKILRSNNCNNCKIPYLKIVAEKDYFFTEEEKSKIKKWCVENKEPELLQVIVIGLNTGCRISNNLSINPDTDIDKGYLRFYHNKTNKPYSVPLNQELKNFPIKKINLSYQQIVYKFNKMKKSLGLDKRATIHTLRHTFCSDLINKGVEAPVVMKLANHKSIQVTMKYTHLKSETLENAVSLL